MNSKCMFTALFLLAATLGAPGQASADEAVFLLDNTKIVGKILHYYDGLLTVQVPGGSTMKLPVTKVKKVQFKLPKSRAEFSTPRKAFDRLRKAALKADLQNYIDCHSAYYQMFLNHQVAMATPAKFVKRLKKEWGNIQLEVLGVEIKGKTALMKVRRKQGGKSQEGEMRFVKENGEWKMILPL